MNQEQQNWVLEFSEVVFEHTIHTSSPYFVGMEANPTLSDFAKIHHLFVTHLLGYNSFIFAVDLSVAIHGDQSYD